jgi:LmbE family N-acetylglucosaminyl deacetylase
MQAIKADYQSHPDQTRRRFMRSDEPESKSVAVIVAHPDDETLWAGGTLLSQPTWRPFIISLCRRSDPDRAPRFFQVLNILDAEGAMGDLDDEPEQIPLEEGEIQKTILGLLPQEQFDIILTHSPAGEYTRHRRHEEVGRAVIRLWNDGRLSADELWAFAYEDGVKRYLPRPIRAGTVYRSLSQDIWREKYRLITQIYGFEEHGFEAKTTPRAEAFWRFTNAVDARQWLENEAFRDESPTSL